ncbi:hypothetical protein CRM22_005377 [Opisthorchis felineus]|uniref:Uncharacterized protein n=1 Tax=Opisthorchis felineus TaxID=147828 RepID=A0A4V3SEY9_OPIFE|nr:hypothetical protein CRM22_005377 [Opisthorchis felineus]
MVSALISLLTAVVVVKFHLSLSEPCCLVRPRTWGIMKQYPLVIGGYTAIKILLASRTQHYLYAKQSQENCLWIANVHPFLDEHSLFEFFSQFGEVQQVEHHVIESGALIRFTDADTCRKILSTPMDSQYSIKLTRHDFPTATELLQSEWLTDYQLEKKYAEAELEAYFRQRLDKKSQVDEDGWIVVDKKRRF